MTEPKDKAKGGKVCEEVALQEFERWASEMDLDIDEQYMDAEELHGFRKVKRRIVGAIIRGALIIDADTGEAVYTPKNVDLENPLRFHELDGVAMMEMDKKRDNENVRKMLAVIAGLCKVQTKTITNLKGLDFKVCRELATLLMD